jgi:hypothetical protein
MISIIPIFESQPSIEILCHSPKLKPKAGDCCVFCSYGRFHAPQCKLASDVALEYLHSKPSCSAYPHNDEQCVMELLPSIKATPNRDGG